MNLELFGRSITIMVHGVTLVHQRHDGDEDANPTLDCDFTVTQHCKPEPLTNEIKIYNLSLENRTRLTAQQDVAAALGWRKLQAVQSGAILVEPGQEAATQAALVAKTGLVEIFAGYQNDASLLCRNQILPVKGVEHHYNGVDWVTTIRAQDGRLPWQNAWVSTSLAPGVLLRDVQQVLLASEQVLEGTLDEGTFEAAYPELLQYKPTPGYRNSVVLHGPTKDMNNNLLETLGLEAFFLNGELTYVRKGATTLVEAVRLSQANNIIGAPEPGERGFYSVQTLLDHRLTPGRQVLLFDSTDIKPIGVGVFRVDQAVHTGSNWSSPFYSNLILRPTNLTAAANP